MSTSFASRRADAEATWGRHGLPSSRLEAWRHTHLRKLAALGGDAQPLAAVASPALPDADGVVVLRDGRLDLGASALPEGVGVVALPEGATDALGSIAETERLEDALVARNLARHDRGFALTVAKGVAAGAVEVRLLGEAPPVEQELRLFVHLERHASLTLVERHLSGAGPDRLVNQVTEVQLDAGAQLSHVWSQRQGAGVIHLNKTAVQQQRDSRYTAQVVQLGGALGRSDIEVYLREPGASCQLDGLYHGRGSQHLDNHSVIHHLADHTSSSEHYKGVLDDRSTGVFRGNVLIHAGARGCSTAQLNRNLLLSPRATVHTKPQLEIDNDDVTASHGATVGQLDETALFYLRSRGIDADTARRLLIFAFVGEIVAQLPLQSLQDELHDVLAERLAAQTGHIDV